MIKYSYWKLVSILLVIFISTIASVAYAENLVANPKFKIGLPVDWERDAFQFSEELFAWNQKRHLVAITIPEKAPNDARWIQKVSVKPNTDYVLSGLIKTQDVQHTPQSVDAGANLSILEELPVTGFFTFSDPLIGNNGWTYRQVQFNSGENSKVTVALRVGMFSGITSGKAWFRKIRLTKAACRDCLD